MEIRKYITKKNVIVGAVAGTAIIGGIVALIMKHNKKKNEDEFEIDEYADEYWDEDLDDDCDDVIPAQLAERVVQYNEAAERLLEELENGTYGR